MPLLSTSPHRFHFIWLAATFAVVGPQALLAQSAGPASPQRAQVPAAAGPTWSALTPTQRTTLAPLERDWASIDPQPKAKWLEIAARYPRMPADEQARVQGRMAEWARLTPAERGRARLTFQEAQQLSPQERQARWEAYQALPDGDRKALAAKAAVDTKTQRPVPSDTDRAAAPKRATNDSRQKPSTPQPVAPLVVQGAPGATTSPITKGATPPAHQQQGQPKIAAKAADVDRATLLPKVTGVTSTAAASASKPGL